MNQSKTLILIIALEFHCEGYNKTGSEKLLTHPGDNELLEFFNHQTQNPINTNHQKMTKYIFVPYHIVGSMVSR